MNRPLTLLEHHRAHIRRWIERTGTRPAARIAGVAPMAVHRYLTNDGQRDVDTHYVLAAAAGVQLTLPLTPPPKRRKVG